MISRRISKKTISKGGFLFTSILFLAFCVLPSADVELPGFSEQTKGETIIIVVSRKKKQIKKRAT